MERFSILFALAFLLLLSNTAATTVLPNSTTDEDALVAFRNSITSDPLGVLGRNWSNDTPICYWIGVSCGIKHPRVTALNISSFFLGGTVVPHLGNLTFLRYLDISSNNFRGFIPFELSKLRRLKLIDVRNNAFGGEVPSWLGTLSQLERLNLRNNSFSGKIPPSLFNNSKLQFLSMSFNYLSGNIPYGIFNVSSIREIGVQYNNLTGWLPSDMCDNIQNLKTLVLSANRFSGQIPTNINKCKDLLRSCLYPKTISMATSQVKLEV